MFIDTSRTNVAKNMLLMYQQVILNHLEPTVQITCVGGTGVYKVDTTPGQSVLGWLDLGLKCLVPLLRHLKPRILMHLEVGVPRFPNQFLSTKNS